MATNKNGDDFSGVDRVGCYFFDHRNKLTDMSACGSSLIMRTDGHRNLHVEIEEDFHRRIKVMCAMKGVTLKQYAADALAEQVTRDEREAKKGA